ncbi:hypothetical protein SFRURICE_010638 [Spodoptera frugiperda]|nr:hypothetical protein SFRURICE_010638 [Spodoptera frugiperda]
MHNLTLDCGFVFLRYYVNRRRGRPRRRWRNELDAYEKDWPQKALPRDEWKEGREAFALLWEDHSRKILKHDIINISLIMNSQNAELTQSSDNVYSYVKNEVADESDQLEENSDFDDSNAPNEEQDIEEDDDDDSENGTDDTGNENDQTDIHKEYTDDVDQVDDSNVQVKGIDTYDDDNDDDISPELEQYVPNDYAEDKPPNIEEEKYGQPEEVNVRPDYQQVPLDYEEAYDMDPIFNDGEVHNNGDKYRDSNNNNYIDSDDNYAVAY